MFFKTLNTFDLLKGVMRYEHERNVTSLERTPWVFVFLVNFFGNIEMIKILMKNVMANNMMFQLKHELLCLPT